MRRHGPSTRRSWSANVASALGAPAPYAQPFGRAALTRDASKMALATPAQAAAWPFDETFLVGERRFCTRGSRPLRTATWTRRADARRLQDGFRYPRLCGGMALRRDVLGRRTSLLHSGLPPPTHSHLDAPR